VLPFVISTIVCFVDVIWKEERRARPVGRVDERLLHREAIDLLERSADSRYLLVVGVVQPLVRVIEADDPFERQPSFVLWPRRQAKLLRRLAVARRISDRRAQIADDCVIDRCLVRIKRIEKCLGEERAVIEGTILLARELTPEESGYRCQI